MNVTQEGSAVRIVDADGACYRTEHATHAAAREECARIRREWDIPDDAPMYWHIDPTYAWGAREPHDYMTPHPQRWAILDAMVQTLQADLTGSVKITVGELYAVVGPALAWMVKPPMDATDADQPLVGIDLVTRPDESLCPWRVARCVSQPGTGWVSDMPLTWGRAAMRLGSVPAVVGLVGDPMRPDQVAVIMPRMDPPTVMARVPPHHQATRGRDGWGRERDAVYRAMVTRAARGEP